MIGGMVKKLIIVTGDKETVYAELLSSLITLKDDDIENNTVVGIKDGSVEAVVWNENIYNDNKAQLGSNTKLIFVGKNKSSEAIIPSIRFDKNMIKYGVYVGSIGNKAVFYIESNTLFCNKDLYDDFYDKYIELTKRFDDSVADTESIKKAIHTDGIGEAFEKGTKAVKGLFGKIMGVPAEKAKTERTDFFKISTKIEASKLIADQMFRYAVLSFYLDGLAEFMEIK